MARSSYIYIAFSGPDIIGTWTVKHEMLTFLQTQRHRHLTHIVRYRDGQPNAGGVVLTLDQTTKTPEEP